MIVIVFDDINLYVDEMFFFVVFGLLGSGKMILFNMIGLLDVFMEGCVQFDGCDVIVVFW